MSESRCITIILDSDPAIVQMICENFPGVQTPTVNANEVHFLFTGARNSIPDLLQQIIKADARVMEFKEDQADLEQVFLSVTHQG